MENPRMTIIILILFFINSTYSHPERNKNILVINFTQCFDIINTTTIEKKLFFYNNTQTKEQCTKIALAEKYRQDIFFPKFFHKCFPLCNSCSDYSKQKNNMKCLSCYRGFKLNNGNCFLNRKYNSKQRLKEFKTIFNTLNLDTKINSNEIIKKYINGETYYFKDYQKSNNNFPKLRRLYIKDDYDDSQNAIFDREDQSTLTNDKADCAYNFHIELSPYYYIAQRCISKGKYFIENDRCVDACSPHLENIFGYTEILIPVGPDNSVKVCDCAFRCCKKLINKLYKSLDRGFIDGSYKYYRKPDGKCLFYNGDYYDIYKENTYILAQDLIPCFFPIYDDNDKFEFYFSGYGKTIVGNRCKTLCPVDDKKQFYFYNSENSGCYKCPENCLECDAIPTEENGHCVKCSDFYHGIMNGFCVVLCPEGYGERNGIKNICQKCEDNEIKIENECVLFKGLNEQYGTEENPTYLDDNNHIHRCLEYISFKTYVFNTDTTKCQKIVKCPPPFYNGDDGMCEDCPTGCYDCKLEGLNRMAKCSSCQENYELNGDVCSGCFFKTEQDGCLESCASNKFIAIQNGEYYCVDACKDDEFVTSERTCLEKCDGIDATFIDEDGFCLLGCNFDYPENFDNHCINCHALGQYNSNGTCVLKDEIFDEVYYPLSGEKNEKHGMVGTCYVIDELGDYHHKKNLNLEYNEDFCINDCPTGFTEKTNAKGEIYCSKCYETCETCDYTGKPGNHKCTKCKDGYEWSTRMYGVCDQICQEGEFFYYEDTREKKCSSECPEHKPYMLEKENDDDTFIECIKSCQDNNQLFLENSFQCLNQCPEGYFLIDFTCVSKCPDGYGPLFDLLKCFNCNNYSLFYYDGNCVKLTDGKLPPNTFIKLDNEEDEENSEDINDLIPGVGNDGKIYSCYEPTEDGEDGLTTGYFNKINTCPEKCPERYYYSPRLQICIKCDDSCLSCDVDTGCSNDCNPPLKLLMSEDFSSISCARNCPDETPIYIDYLYCCVNECMSPDEKKVITINGNNKEINCMSINCKEIGDYYYDETNFCYEASDIPEDTYYNPEEQQEPDENTLSPCLNQISSEQMTTGFFFPISNCNLQCPEHYYYAGNNICMQCHPLCNSCFGGGTNDENNCITCLDTENRILNPYLFNCEIKCEGSFHYDEITKLIVCDEKCERNNYIDEATGNCISSCNKLIEGNYCVDECSEGKTEFNGYCLTDVNIPVVIKTIITVIEKTSNNSNTNTNPNTESNTDSNPNPTTGQNIKNMDLITLIQIIEKNFNQFITLNKNNNFTNIITKDGELSLTEILSNSTSLLSPGNIYTIFYLTNLQEKLKELYPSENSFYFLFVDLKEKKSENMNEKSVLPQTKFKIYLSNGEEVLINDIIPDLEIIIEKDIKFEKKLENNNKLAYDLIQQGINIFDINDPFFNDMCLSYQDEHGNDVTLKNRKEDYFQNILVCIDGCEYLGLNTTDSNNYKMICKCKISSLIINNSTDLYDYIQKDNSNNIKYDNGGNSILELIKCTEEVFNEEEIKNNKGLWTYLSFLGLLLLLYLCFCCYDFDPLYSALFPFSQNQKTGKDEEEIIEEEIITKKELIKSDDIKSSKEEIQSEESLSENKENPPKKGEKINDTKQKYRIRFDKDQKEFPKLNISNFGQEGYKLSNHLDKLDLDTIGDINDLDEEDNNNNLSSPKSNSSFNSNSIHNSSSSENSINYSQKFSPRQVDLEPEGALLDKNNFFDTCKIVKLPSKYSEENYQQRNMGIKANNLILNNNRYGNNHFYRQKKRKVNLPGFPEPKIEKNDLSSVEENENPINRNNKILENIDESNSSSYSSGKSKNIKQEIFNKEMQDNISELETNSKYKKYYIKPSTRRQRHNRRRFMNSITSETFSRQPITINKYYITNNTPEDISKFKNNLSLNSNKKGEKTVTIKRKKIKTNKKFFYDYFSKYDLDFADFEYVNLCEKRTFCQIYISLVSNFQIFLSVFFGNNVFVPWCVRGVIAVFTMELYFTGIAILINFSTLEKRYKFHNTVDIIYLIKNEFSSIIYTSLISKIMNVITMYFLVHYSITKIIKEYAFKENLFLQQIKKEINCIKCKYHIFFIICIILTVIQGYYIYCFCGIYKGAIKPWIFSSLITFGINFILSFVVILIGTILRKLSLYCQSWLVYLFSKLFLLLA